MPSGPASPLGTALDPLLAPLQELTAPVQELVVGGPRSGRPEPRRPPGRGRASRSTCSAATRWRPTAAPAAFRSAGLSLTIAYKGKEQAQLQQLIESIPPELRPSLGPLPNPIAFLTENHIGGLTLGSATVSALASPPFGTS